MMMASKMMDVVDDDDEDDNDDDDNGDGGDGADAGGYEYVRASVHTFGFAVFHMAVQHYPALASYISRALCLWPHVARHPAQVMPQGFLGHDSITTSRALRAG